MFIEPVIIAGSIFIGNKGEFKMNKLYLELYVIDTKKIFKKYFDTEFERDKFARKLRYSKNLKVINKGVEE